MSLSRTRRPSPLVLLSVGSAVPLADKEYMSGQFGSNEFYGAPREYGVTVSVQF